MKPLFLTVPNLKTTNQAEQVPDQRGSVLVWGTEVRTAVLNAVAINMCLTFSRFNVNLDIPGKRDSQRCIASIRLTPGHACGHGLSLLIDA